MVKTVLGDIRIQDLSITLAHEHICCYSEYAYAMVGKQYLDKELLERVAIEYLRELKRKHRLSSLVDCTAVNIGRDLDLLRRISERSEVNIITSTGFYYGDEPLLYGASSDRLCSLIVSDAKAHHAGIIKCAVDKETLTLFQRKLIEACAKAQLYTGLPIVLHTNAQNRNALPALEILVSEGVSPRAVTVGHLSDTEDISYVEGIAAEGFYIGLDRLYGNPNEGYIEKKLACICALVESGYSDQILLSHDALFFNGFEAEPKIYERPRLSYCFDYILPRLPKALADKLMIDNPAHMLNTHRA